MLGLSVLFTHWPSQSSLVGRQLAEPVNVSLARTCFSDTFENCPMDGNVVLSMFLSQRFI